MLYIETNVSNHYADRTLLNRILTALEHTGLDLSKLQTDDLAPVDEFHIGGRQATAYATEKMFLSPAHHVLDIGCGIGGAARYLANKCQCKVTGIDLTPDYIATAEKLTELTGLQNNINFKVATALDMPFTQEQFDAAITFHVAMNIRQRDALYKEIARVMKMNATLCIFDVMKTNDEALHFPVPWAESNETSYLTTVNEMHTLLKQAGFTILEVEDRTEFAIDFFNQILAATENGSPPLGIHLLMGSSAQEKLKNVIENIHQGHIAPVQMIARRKK